MRESNDDIVYDGYSSDGSYRRIDLLASAEKRASRQSKEETLKIIETLIIIAKKMIKENELKTLNGKINYKIGIRNGL